jgi:D-alanyl-lipoteichoic acid acyltransferase DltB (MBOAT superfamily)
MFSLNLTSGIFIFLLCLGPFLMNLGQKKRRIAFLLINSGLFFYCMTLFPQINILLIFFILFPLPYADMIIKKSMKAWPAIILLILTFIYLKGYGRLLGAPFLKDIPNVDLLGLSYILFRQIDFLLQVEAGKVKKVVIIDYFNYLLSFWTIIAGPIQRYRDFVNNFENADPRFDSRESLKCLHRAANGFLKVLLIGAFFKELSDASYAQMVSKGFSYWQFLKIFYFYPLYVYFNFSGYCDVVIAMAKWVGFAIPENFDRPYLSRNMIDFWNRWHITLSQWVRDFVFQPLFKFLLTNGFSRWDSLAKYVSIFITFFLVGLWHGSKINFVIFGLLQGGGMAVSMLYIDVSKKILGRERYKHYENNIIIALIERIVCIHFICFTFLFFEYNIGSMISWIGKFCRLW